MDEESASDRSFRANSREDDEAEWRESKLEELLSELITGSRPTGGGIDEGEYISIGGTQVSSDGHIELENLVYIPEEYLKKVQQTQLREHDILVVKDGANTGDVAIALESDERIVTNEHLFTLRANKSIHAPYLFYFLLSHQGWKQISGTITGSAQEGINRGFTGRVDVFYPPLSEQRKIATVLHTVDKAIQKTEEIIKQTEKVKKGLMSEVFETGYFDHSQYETLKIGPFSYQKPQDWEIVTIGESKKGENGLRRGPFGGMLKKNIFVESGYKVYQQQNIINDDFDHGDYYITEEKFRDMERFGVESGDILITCSGTLGRVAVVPDENEDGVINQALLKLSVSEELFDNQYMKYFLQSKIGQRQLILSSRGSAIKNMAPMGFVRASQVFKPTKSEQYQIANMFQEIDHRIKREKKYKSQFKRLKRGLMQDLLSGTVRTTNTKIQIPDETAQYG